MKIGIISKILGSLLILESFMMGVCTLFALWDRYEVVEQSSVKAFWVSYVVTFLAGVLMVLLSLKTKGKVSRKSALVSVSGGWIFCGVFGALPFFLYDPSFTWTKALFEATAGLTTTGATVIEDLKQWPRSILLWRSLLQWFGGMGILVLFVALLSSLGVGAKALFRHESSAKLGESSATSIRDTALLLWRFYLVFTFICFLGLKLLGMTWFDAINYAFTTVSTGGFSPHNESIAYYSGWKTAKGIQLWLSLFMIISSCNFLLYGWIFQKKWRHLKQEEEGKWFWGILVGSTLLICGVFYFLGKGEFGDLFVEVFFTLSSIASTTGFVIVDYEKWPTFAVIIIGLLMLVGGCAGATSGGLKIGRVVLAVKLMKRRIIKTFHPNQIFQTRFNGYLLDQSIQFQVVVFVIIYLFLVVGGVFLVSLFEVSSGIDMATAFGAVLATLPNMGPGFGKVGPMSNYAHFSDQTLYLLSLLMLIGRLELYAVLVLFLPSLWKRHLLDALGLLG